MNMRQLVALLKAQGLTIATAESCTGGLLAAALTDVPGCSDCFGYGLVTYSNEAKQRVLHVPAEILARHGAVSKETAQAMAEMLRQLSKADLALSITGIAGPGGGTAEKPVGLVYIGLATAAGTWVAKHNFDGDRRAVRAQTVAAAMNMAANYLKQQEETE